MQSADLLLLTKGDLVGAGHLTQVRDWLGETCADTGVVRADAGSAVWHQRAGTAVAPESHVHCSTALRQLEGVHRAKGEVHDAATGQGVLVQCVGRRVSLGVSPPDITGVVLFSTGDVVALETVVVGL